MSDRVNVPPNSERVPAISSFVDITPILRVAHRLYRTYPRIAYLCVCGAYEEVKRHDPSSRGTGVRVFAFSLKCWIQKNDMTSGNGKELQASDLHDMQIFCLDYYVKNIIPPYNEDQASLSLGQFNTACYDQLIHTCETARVLYLVLENLWKDVQQPPEILEAHTEVKRLAEIYRPYDILPNDPPHAVAKFNAMASFNTRPGSPQVMKENLQNTKTNQTESDSEKVEGDKLEGKERRGSQLVWWFYCFISDHISFFLCFLLFIYWLLQ